MSDLLDKLTRKINSASNQFAKNRKKYLQSAVYQGKKIGYPWSIF